MSNKYSSKLDTFIATDLFNLVMPVTPPADLSIASGSFAHSYLFYRTGNGTEVAGFLPTDNAYIRGLALNSNMADGLVPASAGNNDALGWSIIFQPEYYGAALATTVANVAGTDQITGGGGLFEQYLALGMTVMWLDDNRTVRTGVISAIAVGGNSLTLSAVTQSGAGTMFAANTTNGKLRPFLKNAGISIDFPFLIMNAMQPYSFFAWSAASIFAPSGKMSVTAGSAAVSGIGTKFTTDFAAGQPIGYTDNTGVRQTGYIAGIISDTSLLLVNNAAATATNRPVLDLGSIILIKCAVAQAFAAYTISIDPAYATKRLTLNVMAEIEYTFSLPSAGAI